MSAVQLFGVTAAPGGRAPRVRGAESVAFRDVAALVADRPYEEPGPEALADYRRVVESVFREHAVVPAPPGVVFRSRDVLAQWLELHYFTLLDALAFVEDRVVARLAVSREGHPPGEPATMDEAAETVLQDVLRALRRHAVAAVPMHGDEGGHVSAASFLVERGRWDTFVALVRQEGERLPDFSLALTGPWPAYDFVRMQFGS